ncbi:MAG: 1-deoxy-D-xylulose-5-phosphate synthase [Candidatus Sumerlaeota bacterium]|nr:1-deoxy-D-xylulose-5-phosphate synthase [Candidatus Sumerlaeota bacterium]
MRKWLSRIESPADIRGLPVSDLKEIAQEIRETIAETVSKNGGHLGSSLGAVELILALHYVFDTPRDRLIFDVGHQTYAHKLLTGRYDRFPTIRTHGGLAPFTRRAESEYDSFGAGHASTSISAALGMAVARDLKGEEFRVVSITGDGAMTGGICYEGLNNAGALGADLLVILNDNEMSISQNVGAIHRYFNRLITGAFYNEAKDNTEQFIQKFPTIGRKMLSLAHKVEEHIKGFLTPGIFFEELGFRYIGPIDGHRFEQLIPTLRSVRDFRGPVLLHVVTQKGQGYPYSEEDPVVYHGPKGFKIDTGEFSPVSQSKPPLYTDVFAETLTELAAEDEKIVAITPAMAVGSGLTMFEERHPERFFDCGIAEEHAIIFAAGLAAEGLRPFAVVYSTFLQRGFDPVLHDVALQNLPVRLALDRGGLVGADGPTHHGVFDYAYLRIAPNMVVMAPKDENELRRMVKTAQLYDAGPIAFRYPRAHGEGVPLVEPIEPLEIGKGEIVREGADACLIAIGAMVYPALRAADILSAAGIEVEVVNARFVKPLDRELLADCARRHTLLYTYEDHARAGGFGSAVNEALVELAPGRQAFMFAIPDQWVEHGDVEALWADLGMAPENVVDRILDDVRQARPLPRPEPVKGIADCRLPMAD